jgi:hypothetical protein
MAEDELSLWAIGVFAAVVFLSLRFLWSFLGEIDLTGGNRVAGGVNVRRRRPVGLRFGRAPELP